MIDNAIPTVFDYNSKTAYLVSQKNKPTALLFMKPSDKFADYVKVFNEAAWKLKGEVLFARVNGISGKEESGIADSAAVTERNLPTLRIYNAKDKKKYAYTGDVREIKFEDI